jgi:uncharacterized repeat protein (TIGR03803 family)
MKSQHFMCVPARGEISERRRTLLSSGKFGRWNAAYTLFVLCAATAVLSPAQDFKTMASFNGTNGSNTLAPLVQGTDGNLYGTTPAGGAYGYGTIFRVSPKGKLTALYSFCAQVGCPDGREPHAAMIQSTDGNFYGTTAFGGIQGNYGTVFKISPPGKLKTVYLFCAHTQCTDGAFPYGGLVQASDGDFYGTTNEGGDLTCNAPYGCGTVFKISRRGTLTKLHNFHFTDGALPWSELIQARDGNFYGTTSGGGTYGEGTVFRITPKGRLTMLYSFCAQTNCADDVLPYGALVQVADGSFYGTTEGDNDNNNFGSVFKITSSGEFTSLHRFVISDGSDPNDGLVQAMNGKLYGTTTSGGYRNLGTIFEITPSGALTTLYNFCVPSNCDDGGYPSILVQATDGRFYGTTEVGGAYNDGTVFSLGVELPPFVETQPTSGKARTAVAILGTNLTGATSLTFNGTSATFKVVSKSEIRTTVPVGATTGRVEVTTPKRRLKSNVVFRVTK